MSKQSQSKPRFRRFGADWYPNRDGWGGIYKGRYRLVTWRFGSIWQSCVEVHPAVTVLTDKDDDLTAREDYGWMCLRPGKTMNEAMKHARDWCDHERTHTVENVFRDCFVNFKTLFRTRRDVINQLFFVNGNGYEWIDGCLVASHESDPPEERKLDRLRQRESQAKRLQERFSTDEAKATLKLMQEIEDKIDAEEDAMPIGPISEKQALEERKKGFFRTSCVHPSNFYSVCQYARINHIPADVQPDWLEMAYEAAKLLSEEQFCEHCTDYVNREHPAIGKKLIAELESRFPQLTSV